VPPQIRFFQGTGGKRIAYAVDGSLRGERPLLVFSAWWVSHLERDFDDPGFRGLFGRFAEHLTVVRYDRPGVGLSDRERPELSLEDELAHLEALVQELGAERVALFGGSCGGPPAIAYAARHPERTSHLILYGGYACGPKLAPADLQQAMTSLVRAHWGLGSKALTDLFAPNHTTEERQRVAASQRASASPEMAAATLELIYRMDVSDVLAQIHVPTLVLHRKGDRAIGFDHGRQLASLIPGATFVPLDGEAHLPWLGDWQAVADAALAFLVPDQPRPVFAHAPESALGRAAPDVHPDVHSDDNQFVREGEVWSIAFAGRRCHLKHARGLTDLSVLLSRPGEEIFAGQLMAGPDALAGAPASADPILDERARADIRSRLRQLEGAIADAEQAADAAATERARGERDTLLRELRIATGLGGRRRALVDPVERARKAVSGRIRDSIEKIRGALPELARHLDGSITTGSFCAYCPPRPTPWRV
jgi:pimeloyl-ACP methyl ester carboxylesterase